MRISLKFDGFVEYVPYEQIVERVKDFELYKNIGRDASETYDMYMVELGKRDKPTILVLACLHGTEWQSTQYSLTLMEQLRDNKFPNKEFRNNLLSNFHIVCIPVGNPWGYEKTKTYARTRGRNNSNKVNLNRDFYEFTQQETRNIKTVMDELKPFAYMDCHLMAPRKDGGQNYLDLIIGNMTDETESIRDSIADSLCLYANRPVERWDQYTSEHKGLSRRYMSRIKNPYTPVTLSFISEIYRPVKNKEGIVRYLSDQEIMKFGIAILYLFLKSSLAYYNKVKK